MRKATCIFVLLLTVIMMFTLASCNGKGNSTPTASSSNSGSTSVKLDPNADPKNDPLGKYNPEINVTTVHTSNDGAFWFPKGDSIDNNIYTRTWKDKLGINYSFLWTCPGAQGTEKMNTMIASGDLPDMLSVNQTQFQQLYSAGQLEDLTSAVTDYASKYTKKYLTGAYAPNLDQVTRDGKIYGLPNAMSYTDSGDMIWIRADWLKNLGLNTPTNFSELENVMKAFVNNDPDKNGKNDTFAIADQAATLGSNNWGIGNAFFEMFGSYPNIWIKDSNGGLEDGMFGKDQVDKTKKALETLAQYYKDGILDKNFVTLDDAKFQQEVFSNKVGIIFGDIWGAYWPLVLHKDTTPTADWVPITIPGVDGKPGKSIANATSIMNINVVKKGYAHPEALVKMCNLYHDLNNNPETMQFDKYNTDPKDNNQIFLAYPLLIYDPSFNYEGYLAISETMKTGDSSKLASGYKMFYDQIKSYQATGDKSGWPPYRSYTPDGSLGVVDSYIKNKNFMFNEYTDIPDSFNIQYFPTVKKLYDEMALNVITGKQDISAYDEFIKQYNSLYYNTEKANMDKWFAAKGKQSIQSWFESLK